MLHKMTLGLMLDVSTLYMFLCICIAGCWRWRLCNELQTRAKIFICCSWRQTPGTHEQTGMFERSCLSPALDTFAFLDQRYGVMPKHTQHWIKSTARMHLSVRIIGAEIHTYLIIHVGLILAQLLYSFAKLKMNTRLNFRIQKVLLRHLIRLLF